MSIRPGLRGEFLDVVWGLYRLKGYPDGVPNALMHVETRRIAVDVSPWIGMGTVGHFVPDRVWITDGERRVINQRSDPRVSFAGGRHGGRWPVHIPPGVGVTHDDPFDNDK